VDQLVRGRGLPAARTSAIAAALDRAEQASGAARRTALTQLAAQLDGDARRAADGVRVRLLGGAVRDLANAAR
jgi:hypothetical protein